MNKLYVSKIPLPEFALWGKFLGGRKLVSFDLEITARCNNNCRHCYINLPPRDKRAQAKELTPDQISAIADQAVSSGALWCLITGGEPLLRKDFFDIYRGLKEKGLFVSVFTNATLVTGKHIQLFKKYPPRDIEVTVYGISKKTYERVTRIPGSFAAFTRGLDLLLKNNVKVRFKAMALRSNVRELSDIARFCRRRTKDYFRFDPFLHLRFDRDSQKNEDIKSERLSPGEIVAIEKNDPQRLDALESGCERLIVPEFARNPGNQLFHCGTGGHSFTVSYDGFFRLCASLYHPDCIYDLKKGSLAGAWQGFVSRVRDMRSNRRAFLKKCRVCELFNLCIWCPAHAYLETGTLDRPVDYFCEVAHARRKMIEK